MPKRVHQVHYKGQGETCKVVWDISCVIQDFRSTPLPLPLETFCNFSHKLVKLSSWL